jgi:hypothetical protein
VGAAEINPFEVQRRMVASCSRGVPLIGIGVDGTPICDNPVATIPGAVSSRIGLAIRSDGRPVMAFDGGRLYVCADAECTSGTTTSLDLGQDVSMALRNDDRPVLSIGNYFPTGTGQRVVICGNANCTSGNAVRLIDSAVPFSTFSQIALSSSNIPFVAYYLNTDPFAIRLYACANDTCSTGTVRNPVGLGQSTPASLAIRPNGSPVLALRAFGGPGGLYDCNDSSCSSGSVRSYDMSGSYRWQTSVAVRADNRPVVAALINAGQQALLSCNDAGCANATTILLDPNVGFSLVSQSIAIRPDGRPAVLYSDNSGNIRLYDCADSGCNNGTVRILDVGASSSTENQVALTVRPDGRPVAVYRHVNGMRLLQCRNPSCT